MLSILREKEIKLDLQGRALFLTQRSLESTPNREICLVKIGIFMLYVQLKKIESVT
jgi:hypothetical protein